MPPLGEQRLAREIYQQMVESKSGFTSGSTTPIAESVAARLKAAGFPDSDIFVGGANPRKANIVVRYHGTGARRGDERMLVRSFYEGQTFLYQFVKALSSAH